MPAQHARTYPLLFAVLAQILCGPPVRAQDDPSLRPLRWLRLGAEARSLGEAASGVNFDRGHKHLSSLSTVRLSAEVEVRDWLRFSAEFQDARVTAGGDADLQEADADPADIRYAFVEIGRQSRRGWSLRLGRQPLSFGDELLIAADEAWSNCGQRFDGVRASWTGARWKWDLFSATLAPALPGRLDPVRPDDRASGVYGQWSSRARRLSIAPYVFRVRKSQPFPQTGTPAQWNLWTPGVRLTADLPLGLGFSGENAV